MKSYISRLLSCLALLAYASGAAHAAPVSQEVRTITVPGHALRSFDIGYAQDGVYAFADRSNHGVDLIDTRTLRFLGRVTGFAGPKSGGEGGPNGVVIVDGRQIWAGDGGGRIRVADIASRRIIATIATGGKKRVDELAYDAKDHLVIVANSADEPPFLSFISTRAPYRVRDRLALPQATDGLEQPLWDPSTGMVYVAIPQLRHTATHGGVAVIDPHTARLVAMHKLSRCMPGGLALAPGGKLLVGCSDDAVAAGFKAKSILLNPESGKVLRTFAQVGGSDEVWYDQALGDFLLAAVANPGGAVLGVIDARDGRWLANLPSGRHAHSVAADPGNGRAFVPVAAGDSACARGCVKVFGK